MYNVALFRDFKEDRRRSMEIYADNIARALRDIGQDKIAIHEYTPKIPKTLIWLPDRYHLKIRCARYFSYPRQAVCNCKTINHIIEDGYAHLMRRMDPRRTIVTVHDLMPLLRWKGLVKGLGYSHRPRLYEHSLKYLRKAACVIAMSENTKRDLINHCGCEEKKIKVSYQGIDENLRPIPSQDHVQLRKKFDIPGKEVHVILIIGHQIYKNHHTCLKAIERLQCKCKRPVQLVKLGRDYPEWKAYLKETDLQLTPIELKDLTNAQMPELYNSVDCLLFPSLYEGFGRPPLEAMACGTPSVVASTGALPEVVADAGLVTEPQDVEGIALSLQKILEHRETRKKLTQHGIVRAKKFTWKRHAEDLLGIYAMHLS